MQYSFPFLTLTNSRVHSHRLRRLHEVRRKENENVKLCMLNWADRNPNYDPPYHLRLRSKKAIGSRAAGARVKRIFSLIYMFPLFLHLPNRINLPSNRLNAYTWNIAYESSQRINTLYQSQQRIDRQHQIKLRSIASLRSASYMPSSCVSVPFWAHWIFYEPNLSLLWYPKYQNYRSLRRVERMTELTSRQLERLATQSRSDVLSSYHSA